MLAPAHEHLETPEQTLISELKIPERTRNGDLLKSPAPADRNEQVARPWGPSARDHQYSLPGPAPYAPHLRFTAM